MIETAAITKKSLNEAEKFLNFALYYAAELHLPVIPLHTINQKGYCTCGMGKTVAVQANTQKLKTAYRMRQQILNR